MTLRVTLLIGALCAIVSSTAAAQSVGGDPSGQVLARFEDARALAVDPRGFLYVADAGPNVVVMLDSEGQRQQVLGGSGTRAGEFDTPSDVDPTNGQVIVVSDTYNGRVQRFSEDGQYLEALPVGRVQTSEGPGRAFDDGRDGSGVQGDGRPISVASTGNGSTYVLDQRDGTVYRWNEFSGAERIIGGSSGRGRLDDPVSLAVGERGRIYVADAGREQVLVFQRFGTFLRALPVPNLPHLQSVSIRDRRVWVTTSDRLILWNPRAKSMRERTFSLEEELVDSLPHSTGLYILTRSRLIRYMNP